MLLAELNGLGAMIIIILLIMFGVPLILLIIGISLRDKNPETSKKLIIASVVYVLIGLGICGSMMI